MTKKKQPQKSKRVGIGIRLLEEHREEINRAALLYARNRGLTTTRPLNHFCINVLLTFARKVLADADQSPRT